ncbi:MAG: hypothetical protein DMG13_02855, partial [Acidobacteria bacterium]
MRTVFKSVGGRHLEGRFLAKEFLLRPADRRQFLAAAIAQGNLLTGYEENGKETQRRSAAQPQPKPSSGPSGHLLPEGEGHACRMSLSLRERVPRSG